MVWSLVYYRRRDAVLLKNTTHGYGLEYGSNGTQTSAPVTGPCVPQREREVLGRRGSVVFFPPPHGSRTNAGHSTAQRPPFPVGVHEGTNNPCCLLPALSFLSLV